jgi:hypothetical protein
MQYGRLDPIGMLIGTVADFNEIYADLNDRDREKIENNLMNFMINQMEGTGQDSLSNYDKTQNMVIAGYKSIFKNIASKTYLRSLIDFLTAINGDDIDKRGAWWIRNKASSFWPNIFSKATNDPYLRETRSLLDDFKKKIGLGLHKDVQLAYNLMGEPIENKQNVAARYFNAIVNPLTIKMRENDFVLEKIIEHEINIPPLSPVKEGVDLREFVDENGKSAFDYYNEEIAKSSLRKDLSALFKSKRFNDAADQIILDKNNKFGGKKALTYQKVKAKRDLIFKKIKYSSKFTSKQNKEITLGSAYVNKNLITTIGKKTNKYPKNLKKGIYDFIQSSP